MQFHIITLFPEMFATLKSGVVGRALANNLIQMHFWNPRDYCKDNYGKVDDRPYGGGPGMVMMIEPLRDAIHAAKQASGIPTTSIYMSPQGNLLTQSKIASLVAEHQAGLRNIILLAGRYEGVDERLIEMEINEEISIGDYVLSGGEIPAMVLIDALTRTLPGVLGDDESAEQDSFVQGIFDYPHYTRPETFLGKEVPKVLLSGNHAEIARWRLKQALGRTWLRRPDLLANRQLTTEESMLLNEFISEHGTL